ncbi:MAG: carboxypeptidase regulatory-like domain-containing protein [Anaerolineales bacterium]|nr:MAG: carboxypeptidase regulatory-like domain-containing protein [Anaerolineales bacterium]
MKPRIASLIIIAALLLAGCAPSNGTDDAVVATLVAAALQTSEAANPPVLETVGPQLGYVEGSTCYPSSFIPEMTVFLQKAGAPEPVQVPIALNQMSFSAELEPGSYTAYAWLPDFSFGGSYSHAVACGLSVDCTDHSLVSFDVVAGELTEGIAVCDWYGQPGDVPYPPGAEPPAQESNDPGSISGSLSYPSSFIPGQTIVAWSLANPGNYYYVTTSDGTSFYQISNLPPGDYQVVAYTNGMAGGYSQFVPCGLSVNCSDHSLIVVTVTSGQETGGVNPQDWYAPDGAFPANPVP